jgi:hypothetical protein
MLLQSLRALCKAPGGPGNIWKCLEALVRATGVSGRFACGFQTDSHFADVGSIYLADPEIDRHHLNSIPSYRTMKIDTLSFGTFGLTRSVQELVDPGNCVDH